MRFAASANIPRKGGGGWRTDVDVKFTGIDMSDILSIQELKNISDRKQIKGIIEWLELNGIPYLPSAVGVPKVHRLALAHRMGVPVNFAEESDGPDLSKVM